MPPGMTYEFGGVYRTQQESFLGLLLVALAVTAVTYVFESSSAVYFGILQCLAFSILIYGAAFEKAVAAQYPPKAETPAEPGEPAAAPAAP